MRGRGGEREAMVESKGGRQRKREGERQNSYMNACTHIRVLYRGGPRDIPPGYLSFSNIIYMFLNER